MSSTEGVYGAPLSKHPFCESGLRLPTNVADTVALDREYALLARPSSPASRKTAAAATSQAPADPPTCASSSTGHHARNLLKHRQQHPCACTCPRGLLLHPTTPPTPPPSLRPNDENPGMCSAPRRSCCRIHVPKVVCSISPWPYNNDDAVYVRP